MTSSQCLEVMSCASRIVTMWLRNWLDGARAETTEACRGHRRRSRAITGDDRCETG
jgi:hypothetical protein